MRRLQRPHREEAEEEKTNFSLSFETCLVVRGPLCNKLAVFFRGAFVDLVLCEFRK